MTGRGDRDDRSAEQPEPDDEKRRQRRELLRQMTQDSIDMDLYDLTAEQLER